MKQNCKSGFGGESVTRLFLGLCPVAAAATCAANGLAIGICVLIVLIGSGLLIAALKKLLTENALVPASVFIICMMTGAVQILLNRWMPALAGELGVFVPLCAVSAMLCLLPDGCACLACRGFRCGIASFGMLTVLGVLCELIGSGSVFGTILWENANAHLLIARFPAGIYILLGILLGIIAPIRNHGKEGTK